MRWALLILLSAVMALNAGCVGSMKGKRLLLHKDKLESYSEEKRTAILKGTVAKGMTSEEVYMARGVPEVIERVEGSPHLEEKWVYRCRGNAKLAVEFERGAVIDVRSEGK